MIPKIIHYCWFGRGEMSQLAKDCIASWHKYMPDWEYKLWNEDNFDIYSNQYVKEAYESKKYAFVTDYVRLYALKTEGGVYMDTDVESLKAYDNTLMRLPAFTGYEGSKKMPPVTGTMASEANGEWVTEQLAYYDTARFIKDDGTLDLTSNTITISRIMQENGFVPDGKHQIYKGLHVFPVEYFCPRQTTGEILITDNTYCDHHFIGSWSDKKGKFSLLKKIIGQQNMTRLIKLKRRLIG